MARYEHLPIYRAAFDLAVHMEKIVRHFSRYHEYSLGTELRERSRRILERVMEANSRRDQAALLLQLSRAQRSLRAATVVLPRRIELGVQRSRPCRALRKRWAELIYKNKEILGEAVVS